MSNAHNPTPIAEQIPIDESQLDQYPAWQRAIRRRQLEAQAKVERETQKREAEAEARKLSRVKELREWLANQFDIDVPDDTEVELDEIHNQYQLHFGGYLWRLAHTGYNKYIYISKRIPEALTDDELQAIEHDWYSFGDYKNIIIESENLSNFNVGREEKLASILDAIDKKVAEAIERNPHELEKIRQAVAKDEQPTEPQLTTEYHYWSFAQTLDKPESAKTHAGELKALEEAGWQIIYESATPTDAKTVVWSYRFSRQVEISNDQDTAEAETTDDLSVYEASIAEILGDDDDEPDTVDEETPETQIVPASPVGEYNPIVNHLIEKGSIGNIGVAILTHGVEKVKAAMDYQAFSTLPHKRADIVIELT